ncbi:MAG: hypothetical protein AVDCRST_MAG47-1091, partial [uncultured Nocardioidaceae bacterium]
DRPPTVHQRRGARRPRFPRLLLPACFLQL